VGVADEQNGFSKSIRSERIPDPSEYLVKIGARLLKIHDYFFDPKNHLKSMDTELILF